jgi:Ger(x)C family germination protein
MGSRLIILLVLAIFLVTAGCGGARETDEVGYVIAMGIDKGPEKDNLKVTYQLAIPRALSGTGSSDSKEATEIITVTATTLVEARNLLNTTIARIPNLSHVKVIIIGESLARQGVGDFVAPLQRFREFRGSMYIVVSHDSTAEEFIKKLTPRLEILPSKYIETMMLSNTENGYYGRSFLHDFYNRLKGGSAAPYASLVAVNSMDGKDRPTDKKSPGEKNDEYTAGDIPLTGDGAATNFAGLALFKADKMVGTLTNEECRVVSLLEGKNAPTCFLAVTDPNVPEKSINIIFRLGRKPKTEVTMQDGHFSFDVDVMLEAEVTSIPSAINYEMAGYKEQLEDQISQVVQAEMMNMLEKTQFLGADPVGFGYQARAMFRTLPEWKEIDWDKKYSKADFRVKVNTKIRRSALMWQSSPIAK